METTERCPQPGLTGEVPWQVTAAAGGEDLAAAEQVVAELMGEDLGTAMKFLQARGLCLMPISLATTLPEPTAAMLTAHPAANSDL